MSFCIIYILKNKINDKIYIGQTWRPLKNRFNNGYSGNPYLFNAIKKYDKNNFYYEVLTIAHTQNIANYWETYFINKYNSLDRNIGYNIKEGGSNGKLSEETKKKLSEFRKGKKLSLETRKKMSISKIGENNSFYGKVHSDETRNKISEAQKGERHNNFGKTHSEETKNKMSISNRGEKHYNAKLNEIFVIEILELLKNNVSITDIAEKYNVGVRAINKIKNGTRWKHVIRK